jgi:cell division protein FtsX
MKNFLVTIFAIVFLSSLLQPFLPWYIIAVVAFIAGYFIKQSAASAFGAGFVAIFLLWVSYAFVLSHANNDLLAHKVALLLPMKGHVSILLLVTGIIGGLVSGCAALSGRFAAAL